MALHSMPGQGGVLPWMGVVLFLVMAFAVPAMAMALAMRFSVISSPTMAQLYARRAAILAVAAPTIFTFAGVVLYMLGDPVSDVWSLVAFWGLVAVVVVRAGNRSPWPAQVHNSARPFSAKWRMAHGISALLILFLFLGLHLVNHLVGLIGSENHMAVMKAFRVIYRAGLVEPVIVGLFLFQVGSGLYFVGQYTRSPSDRFRTFQLVSGVYLAFYIIGHMNSVFIYARTYQRIDTGWNFAIGAPTGLIEDAWNIRLLPHYALGIFFVLSHLFAGARQVMLTHGAQAKLANRVMIGGALFAACIATAIMIGMCGGRL
ncbi:hypothetical protein [Dyella tabacisoli]|uniref:Uncharacterized protein n=1 Tax=Dyella tabacisoli TaxID=2282381 RepID=A0A369USR1_9GAMM|nr:hypothetical protein [Dyella tabacisoli]RDD83085.1 hypothetical protein DVJ77_00215 [Dyella tabacisoli]